MGVAIEAARPAIPANAKQFATGRWQARRDSEAAWLLAEALNTTENRCSHLYLSSLLGSHPSLWLATEQGAPPGRRSPPPNKALQLPGRRRLSCGAGQPLAPAGA